uniref:Uncharacterized protein n=1 Tax=Anguilla anguilla TaxID=7936 RepID=A0A0E9P783_ANGAN
MFYTGQPTQLKIKRREIGMLCQL